MTSQRMRVDIYGAPLLVAAVALWQVGTHVDAWYHFHRGFEIESFVTWPHAMLYAGWFASLALAAGRVFAYMGGRNQRHAWPPGGRLMLLGTALFGIGGVLDAAWHATFGFEMNLAAFWSPAHDWLLIAGLLTAAGLVQATQAWRQQRAAGIRYVSWSDVPLIVSLGALLRITLWVFFYSDPLAVDYASGGANAGRLWGYVGIDWTNEAAQIAGTQGILLHSLVLGLFIALILYHLRLPSGALITVLLWNGLFTAATTDEWLYLPAVAIGGVGGEVSAILHVHGSSAGLDQRARCWLVAAIVPLVQFASAMLLTHALGGGLVWTAHLWAGAPVLAGLFGLIGGKHAAPPSWAAPAPGPVVGHDTQ